MVVFGPIRSALIDDFDPAGSVLQKSY